MALPARLLRESIQDYVRSAHETLRFAIHDCQCWSDPQDAMPEITIPFVAAVEVGVLTQVQYFRERSGRPRAPLASILANEDFESISGGPLPELCLGFVASSLAGGRGNSQGVYYGGSFGTMTISNLSGLVVGDTDAMIPDVMESSLPNSPDSKTLVLHRRRVSEGSPPLAELYKSGQFMVEWLRDPSVQARPELVWEVEISVTRENDSFLVMVDGAIFGPFTKIHIRQRDEGSGTTSCEDYVDVMSYFPICTSNSFPL